MVPLAIPPKATTSVPPAPTVADRAMPPEDTVAVPPLPTKVALTVPPADTIWLPPALTTLKLATPPDETVSMPPLLTTVSLAMPPAATLNAAIQSRGTGDTARHGLRSAAGNGRQACQTAGRHGLDPATAYPVPLADCARGSRSDPATQDGVGDRAAEDDLGATAAHDGRLGHPSPEETVSLPPLLTTVRLATPPLSTASTLPRITVPSATPPLKMDAEPPLPITVALATLPV